ncbi:homoserine kinase [Pseudodesulfovibrio tunisiensis]|uniref:homoserine kinase n=1 Tax=Pseudodesulfovibrio tunisiensis TaxID=463192 RepID=UPI001FB2DD52|nr:homoserine kinase [Pseudodesulfovibrio tunisiensis]
MPFPRLERDEKLRPCVTLVGMAGAGKSTLAPLLAERLGWGHLDTDQLMEAFYGLSLQSIMDTFGLKEFLRIEDNLVADLSLNRMVISTGGSVIYGKQAMNTLRTLGPIVHLEVGKSAFLERVGNGEGRGLAIAPGTSLLDLYNERQPLYRAVADITVHTDRDTPDQCADLILKHIEMP